MFLLANQQVQIFIPNCSLSSSNCFEIAKEFPQILSHVVNSRHRIPLYVSNTCAFDTLAQIVVTGIYAWRDSGDAVSRFAMENRFFKFIADVIQAEEVSGNAYLQRFSILQPLRPYRGSLKIIENGNGLSHAQFDAQVNLVGLTPYILNVTAPSIMFHLNPCDDGHVDQLMPIKVLSFNIKRLMVHPGSMDNLLGDSVRDFTAASAMVGCPARDCRMQRQRTYLETGLFVIKYYRK